MLLTHQQNLHPNAHLAASPWSEEQTLHMACMYSNPQRSDVRRKLFNDFRKRTENAPNVKLYVGEVVLNERPFEVTSENNPLDFQFRIESELWLKENVLNLIVQRMPASAKYIGYIDGDILNSRYDWALEAIHQLQHYSAVQLFHQFTDVDYRHRPLHVTNGFAYEYGNAITSPTWQDKGTKNSPSVKKIQNSITNPDKTVNDDGNTLQYLESERLLEGQPTSHNPDALKSQWWGATGLGWAFKRKTWNDMGGLFDQCILGAADWIMAYGMVGLADGLDITGCIPYYQAIKIWQQHAATLKANVWYVDNHITHFWHGSKDNRFYRKREDILIENNFDPRIDLIRDWQGLWQLAGNKPKLRDDLRHYFRARNEDDISLGPNDKLIT